MNRRTPRGPAGLLLAGLALVLSQVPASAHTHGADFSGEAHFAHEMVSTHEAHLHEQAPLAGEAANELAHSTDAHRDADVARHTEDASHFDAASEHAVEAAGMAHHEIAAQHHQQA